MKLFKRNKNDSNKAAVPEELQTYYNSPSGWNLWLRRILAILVIVLVLLAMAGAARAVYRSVTDDDMADQKADTPTSNQATEPKPTEPKPPTTDQSRPAQPATPKPTEINSQPPAQTIPKTGDDAPTSQPVLPATGG